MKSCSNFFAVLLLLFFINHTAQANSSRWFSGDEYFYDNGSPPEAEVELGRFLFFDKILSGNKNISCATCHHPLTDTGDGMSLSTGEGARGLGITRNAGEGSETVHERVPRNAPPLFNLGAREYVRMFHDGRAEVNADHPSGFDTPAGNALPLGLDNVLAAQAMFPVTSSTEMAGQTGENPVADAIAMNQLAGTGGVWDLLAARLRDNGEYVELFREAYDISKNEITFAHAANAIAAYETKTWRADRSPFDYYLRGNWKAMSFNAIKGMYLFYDKAGCAGCHSGYFQTDHQFHAIGMPQIGPGKGDGFDGHEDFGRERVSGDSADRYRFRTPSLRNVALTGPWGHNGAYNNLEGVIRHHLNPAKALASYDCATEPVLASNEELDQYDCVVQNDAVRVNAIAVASELHSKRLSKREVKRLVDFLHALTDPRSLDLRGDMPKRVPSGLSMVD